MWCLYDTDLINVKANRILESHTTSQMFVSSILNSSSNDHLFTCESENIYKKTQTFLLFTFNSSGFPFYTIGRFQNTPCQGKNKLLGTCVLDGECNKSGGIPAGSCSSITRQAVCCICKLVLEFIFLLFFSTTQVLNALDVCKFDSL